MEAKQRADRVWRNLPTLHSYSALEKEAQRVSKILGDEKEEVFGFLCEIRSRIAVLFENVFQQNAAGASSASTEDDDAQKQWAHSSAAALFVASVTKPDDTPASACSVLEVASSTSSASSCAAASPNPAASPAELSAAVTTSRHELRGEVTPEQFQMLSASCAFVGLAFSTSHLHADLFELLPEHVATLLRVSRACLDVYASLSDEATLAPVCDSHVEALHSLSIFLHRYPEPMGVSSPSLVAHVLRYLEYYDSESVSKTHQVVQQQALMIVCRVVDGNPLALHDYGQSLLAVLCRLLLSQKSSSLHLRTITRVLQCSLPYSTNASSEVEHKHAFSICSDELSATLLTDTVGWLLCTMYKAHCPASILKKYTPKEAKETMDAATYKAFVKDAPFLTALLTANLRQYYDLKFAEATLFLSLTVQTRRLREVVSEPKGSLLEAKRIVDGISFSLLGDLSPMAEKQLPKILGGWVSSFQLLRQESQKLDDQEQATRRWNGFRLVVIDAITRVLPSFQTAQVFEPYLNQFLKSFAHRLADPVLFAAHMRVAVRLLPGSFAKYAPSVFEELLRPFSKLTFDKNTREVYPSVLSTLAKLSAIAQGDESLPYLDRISSTLLLFLSPAALRWNGADALSCAASLVIALTDQLSSSSSQVADPTAPKCWQWCDALFARVLELLTKPLELTQAVESSDRNDHDNDVNDDEEVEEDEEDEEGEVDLASRIIVAAGEFLSALFSSPSANIYLDQRWSEQVTTLCKHLLDQVAEKVFFEDDEFLRQQQTYLLCSLLQSSEKRCAEFGFEALKRLLDASVEVREDCLRECEYTFIESAADLLRAQQAQEDDTNTPSSCAPASTSAASPTPSRDAAEAGTSTVSPAAAATTTTAVPEKENVLCSHFVQLTGEQAKLLLEKLPTDTKEDPKLIRRVYATLRSRLEQV